MICTIEFTVNLISKLLLSFLKNGIDSQYSVSCFRASFQVFKEKSKVFLDQPRDDSHLITKKVFLRQLENFSS